MSLYFKQTQIAILIFRFLLFFSFMGPLLMRNYSRSIVIAEPVRADYSDEKGGLYYYHSRTV